MIVTCPSCTTRYFAEDSAIGPQGRSVRCASCGHSWFIEPQLVLDQAAPDDLLPAPRAARAPLTRDEVERIRQRHAQPQSATAKIRERQLDRRRQERLRASAVSWAGVGATIAATAVGAVVFREDVASLWPQTASAYAAAGMPVNVHGLEFVDLAIERSYDGPTPILVVSGELRNVSGEARLAPAMRFALRDDQGRELYRWIVASDGREIQAGAALPFETLVDNPPIQAADLEATIATAEEALEAVGPALPPKQQPIVAPRGFTDEPLAQPSESPQVQSALEPEIELAPLRAGPAVDPAPSVAPLLAIRG